jgi:hypothetical protein
VLDDGDLFNLTCSFYKLKKSSSLLCTCSYWHIKTKELFLDVLTVNVEKIEYIIWDTNCS